MLEYRIGNLKIGRNTMIINMGSARHCPSGKAGLCDLYKSGRCYALNPESWYKGNDISNPANRPYLARKRQAAYWRRARPERILKDIQAALRRHKRIKYIRFNEVGDFYGQTCVNKLSYIAEGLTGRARVYTYTHRRDLAFKRVSGNLTINGSGFMVHNNFKTVKAFNGNRIRCAGDCRDCSICTKRRGVTIDCMLH